LALHQQAADELGGDQLSAGLSKKEWGRAGRVLVAMGVDLEVA